MFTLRTLLVVVALAALATALLELRRARRSQAALRAQLLQAQKFESIGLLAGAVAHDFNNLLSAIRSYGELVAANTNGANAERARRILDAADRAATLTRDLLTYSRGDRGVPRPVEVGRLVRETTAMVARLLGPRIAIECETPDEVVARVEPGQLQQVLLNLVVNARDAMPDGGELRIATRSVPVDAGQARRFSARPGPYALLEVHDTGIGIPAEVQAQMFEPFFTTKAPDLGTGLGLSIVHGIVRRHDGFVAVQSRAGEGTTFSVYLPALSA
jgi:signal transduction histidine kinase